MGVRINDVMIARAVLARYGHSPDGLMVDMVPPATARDRWMYEQGRLAERDPRSHAAPQASEAVRNAALEEAEKVALNAPITADMLDSDDAKALAFHTHARICALKSQPKADKDGVQPAEEPADFAPPTGASTHHHCVSGGPPTGRNES
ncbi:hypothetical protein D3C87_1648780 [compost metagenome]